MNGVEVVGGGKYIEDIEDIRDVDAGVLLIGPEYIVPSFGNEDEEIKLNEVELLKGIGLSDGQFLGTEYKEGYKAGDPVIIKKHVLQNNDSRTKQVLEELRFVGVSCIDLTSKIIRGEKEKVNKKEMSNRVKYDSIRNDIVSDITDTELATFLPKYVSFRDMQKSDPKFNAKYNIEGCSSNDVGERDKEYSMLGNEAKELYKKNGGDIFANNNSQSKFQSKCKKDNSSMIYTSVVTQKRLPRNLSKLLSEATRHMIGFDNSNGSHGNRSQGSRLIFTSSMLDAKNSRVPGAQSVFSPNLQKYNFM